MSTGHLFEDIDKELMPWAQKNQIRVITEFRDDVVRSIAMHDKAGNFVAHMWLGVPDSAGNLILSAAELDDPGTYHFGRTE